MDPHEKKKLLDEWDRAVNMTPRELEQWLGSEDSRSVGWKEDGDGESVGHASGRQIVQLLHKRRGDMTEDDLAHIRKVIGYVHRHKAQRPSGDIHGTPWRYSLMNWGHDPEKP